MNSLAQPQVVLLPEHTVDFGASLLRRTLSPVKCGVRVPQGCVAGNTGGLDTARYAPKGMVAALGDHIKPLRAGPAHGVYGNAQFLSSMEISPKQS